MGKLTGLTAAMAFGLVLILGAHAGEFKRADVAATAKWVIHMDLDKIKDASLGKRMLEEAGKEEFVEHFQTVKDLYGFDFRKDLKGLTMYGSVGAALEEGSAPEHPSTAVVRGTLDQDKFVAQLKSRDGFESATYGNYTLMKVIPAAGKAEAEVGPLAGQMRTKPAWGCFQAKDTFVMCDSPETLKAALDVIAGKAASLAKQNSFTHLDELEKSPLFLAAANLGEMQNIDPQAAIFRQTQSVSLAVREIPVDPEKAMAAENANLQLLAIVDGKNEDGALQIKQSVDGLLAIAMLNAQKQPLLAQLAQSIKVTQDKLTITIVFTHQVADLLQKFDQVKNTFAPALDFQADPQN